MFYITYNLKIKSALNKGTLFYCKRKPPAMLVVQKALAMGRKNSPPMV